MLFTLSAAKQLPSFCAGCKKKKKTRVKSQTFSHENVDVLVQFKQILKSQIRAKFGDAKTAARAKEKAYQKVERPTIIYVLEMLALTQNRRHS